MSGKGWGAAPHLISENRFFLPSKTLLQSVDVHTVSPTCRRREWTRLKRTKAGLLNKQDYMKTQLEQYR